MEQTRHLVTELPGPKAQALTERQHLAVARGVSALMPTFAVRAEAGILEDVDGNRLIDLGSGIAVTSIGASAPKVVEAVLSIWRLEGHRILPLGSSDIAGGGQRW